MKLRDMPDNFNRTYIKSFTTNKQRQNFEQKAVRHKKCVIIVCQCIIKRILHECSPCCRYRGSYMSAHVLLNLLNEFGKRENGRLAEHCISLCNEFNWYWNLSERLTCLMKTWSDFTYKESRSLKCAFEDETTIYTFQSFFTNTIVFTHVSLCGKRTLRPYTVK